MTKWINNLPSWLIIFFQCMEFYDNTSTRIVSDIRRRLFYPLYIIEQLPSRALSVVSLMGSSEWSHPDQSARNKFKLKLDRYTIHAYTIRQLLPAEMDLNHHPRSLVGIVGVEPTSRKASTCRSTGELQYP